MAPPLAKEALLSGWRLIRRAPLAVLAWWVLLVSQQVSYQVINPFIADGPQHLVFEGLLVTLAFEALVVAAVFRAQFRPEKPGPMWLRLGWAEVEMLVLIALAGFIAVLIAAPISIAVSYGLAVARWPVGISKLLPLGGVAALLALVRFSMLPAMIVDTGQADIRAAWRAMRGRYWTLLAFVLVLGLAGWAFGVIWDLVMQLPPGPGYLEAPKVIHISVWPSPHALLQAAGHELLTLILLIFISSAIVAVWRASRQTVD